MKVVLLVDRHARGPGLIARRGLSLGLEHEGLYFLFDVGPDPMALAKNAERIGFPLELVEFVVLSHQHITHVGGLEAVGWASPYAKVYIPYGTSELLGKFVEKNSLVPLEVIEGVSPAKGVTITSALYGPPWEHFLLVEASTGTILFTGCAHPGLGAVLDKVVKRSRLKVAALVGGFHAEFAPPEVIEAYAESIQGSGVEEVVPLHCSGDKLKEALGKYGIRTIELKVGDSLEL